MFADTEAAELAGLLGMGRAELSRIQEMQDIDAAKAALARLQADLPARYKAAAFNLHPDRNRSKDSTRRFQRLGEILDQLQALRLNRYAPMPTPIRATYSGTTTSTVTSAGGWVRFH